MNLLGIYDPLLGRLRTQDTKTEIFRQTIESMGGGGGAPSSTVETGSDLPDFADTGSIFLDTDDDILYVYYGGVWHAISGGGTTPVVVDARLTQADDYRIDQAGNYRIDQSQ